MQRRNLIIISVAATLLVAWLIVSFAVAKTGTFLTVEVAPKDSSITINHKAGKAGSNRVTPGLVHVEVSRKGFITGTQDINVANHQKRYVGFALTPNTAETLSWYTNHPADQILAEKLSSKTFDDVSSNAAKNVPLVKDLPYIGAGDEYEISYGPGANGSDDQPTIHIATNSEAGKADALDWIRYKGFDPSKLTIVYDSL